MNTSYISDENKFDKRIFLILFSLAFVIFVYSNDGHRFSFDEDITQRQALLFVTHVPNPLFVDGESKIFYEYPTIFPNPKGLPCANEFLCSAAYIGHTLTEIPFLVVNHYFHIISHETISWSFEDFGDHHYVYWRNSIDPDFTFLELFYGPLFSALSVGIFFLLVRRFNVSKKNSTILTLFFAFTTPIWAYSQTSLNSVPNMFFVLLGVLFFKKFTDSIGSKNLIFSGISLGFAFLIRPDAIYFILPIFSLFLFLLKKRPSKIKNFILFSIPLGSSFMIYRIIEHFKYIGDSGLTVPGGAFSNISFNFAEIVGLLFSPGAGLFVFSPILITFIFSFPDFFKKHKLDCILFSSFFVIFVFQYAQLEYWHGFVSWSTRYIYPIIPFLLIPLGISLGSRRKLIYVLLIVLGSIGFLANFAYVIQDVSWFIWGQMGDDTRGLYALDGIYPSPLRIHPATIWTFEYSQLTHSILNALYALKPDILLLTLFGESVYLISMISFIAIPIYFLLRIFKVKNNSNI